MNQIKTVLVSSAQRERERLKVIIIFRRLGQVKYLIKKKSKILFPASVIDKFCPLECTFGQ